MEGYQCGECLGGIVGVFAYLYRVGTPGKDFTLPNEDKGIALPRALLCRDHIEFIDSGLLVALPLEGMVMYALKQSDAIPTTVTIEGRRFKAHRLEDRPGFSFLTAKSVEKLWPNAKRRQIDYFHLMQVMDSSQNPN